MHPACCQAAVAAAPSVPRNDTVSSTFAFGHHHLLTATPAAAAHQLLFQPTPHYHTHVLC